MADLGLAGFAYQPSANAQKYGKSTPITINQREVEAYENNHAVPRQEYWQTGFRARFPWVGFGAILLMLGCIGSTIAILVTSNGKAKEQWPGESTLGYQKATANKVYSGGKLDIYERQMAETSPNYPVGNPRHY